MNAVGKKSLLIVRIIREQINKRREQNADILRLNVVAYTLNIRVWTVKRRWYQLKRPDENYFLKS
jgi:hypothetical protein